MNSHSLQLPTVWITTGSSVSASPPLSVRPPPLSQGMVWGLFKSKISRFFFFETFADPKRMKTRGPLAHTTTPSRVRRKERGQWRTGHAFASPSRVRGALVSPCNNFGMCRDLKSQNTCLHFAQPN